jgi:periplasmic protein CpxP/Spy
MTRTQWMVVTVGVLCVIGASYPSSFAAQGHGQMQHDGHDQDEQGDHSARYLKHLLKQAKEIGLTQEQIGKLKALQLEFKRTEARLEADVKIAKLDLQALLEDEKADLGAIQAKVGQLKNSEGACLFAAIKSKHNAMALLTPDQREKDRAHREAMKSEHEGQHGGGMGGMGHGGMMGGAMGGSGHGQGSGEHGSGGAGGGQQHQH